MNEPFGPSPGQCRNYLEEIVARKAKSAATAPESVAMPLVGTGSWLSVGAQLRNKHSGNAAEIYDHPRPGAWTIRLLASSHVFERTTAEVMQHWAPTDNQQDQLTPAAGTRSTNSP